ncbi:hypothetical protein Ciccas_014259 [Cichlidogyrus casuarinus]|uniref:Uncharacterized protein n=1 Tax=Cichlidogyrus casuarinus TaxID=1844966 RepID=A0ABD2PIL3_9PLAT
MGQGESFARSRFYLDSKKTTELTVGIFEERLTNELLEFVGGWKAMHIHDLLQFLRCFAFYSAYIVVTTQSSSAMLVVWERICRKLRETLNEYDWFISNLDKSVKEFLQVAYSDTDADSLHKQIMMMVNRFVESASCKPGESVMGREESLAKVQERIEAKFKSQMADAISCRWDFVFQSNQHCVSLKNGGTLVVSNGPLKQTGTQAYSVDTIKQIFNRYIRNSFMLIMMIDIVSMLFFLVLLKRCILVETIQLVNENEWSVLEVDLQNNFGSRFTSNHYFVKYLRQSFLGSTHTLLEQWEALMLCAENLDQTLQKSAEDSSYDVHEQPALNKPMNLYVFKEVGSVKFLMCSDMAHADALLQVQRLRNFHLHTENEYQTIIRRLVMLLLVLLAWTKKDKTNKFMIEDIWQNLEMIVDTLIPTLSTGRLLILQRLMDILKSIHLANMNEGIFKVTDEYVAKILLE